MEGDDFYPLVDPSNGEVFAHVAAADGPMVESALESARLALDDWKSLSAHRRSELLHALAAGIRGDRKTLAPLISREVGKLLKAAFREVESAAALIDYFAEENLRLMGQIPLLGLSRQQVLIVREPVGVVGAITPFNYPLSTLACKIAPALAVGCTVVAKPDEHTPLGALRLAEIARDAGFPVGVFNVATGMGAEAGRALAGSPLPRLITFTGSTSVGKEIQAAGAQWVRKVILELGGCCPAILCKDADWRRALPELINQGFNNSGQYCYRVSRIYAAESIYTDFLAAFVERASRLRVGRPDDPDADIGPLNNADILAAVSAHVDGAVAEGARVELGGAPVEVGSGGFYYPPTVLTRVRPDMRIVREEVFGPVVLVTPFRDVSAVIDEVNSNPYGLAAYIFSENAGNALEWAGRIEAGSVWINRIHQAYPEAPFGGMKESGLGREKSHFGLEEYTELKTVYLSY
ncbi:MAG: aldehyde dehydrogenase [Syntrophobacteraceae bacterium]